MHRHAFDLITIDEVCLEILVKAKCIKEDIAIEFLTKLVLSYRSNQELIFSYFEKVEASRKCTSLIVAELCKSKDYFSAIKFIKMLEEKCGFSVNFHVFPKVVYSCLVDHMLEYI